ncbi:MAG: glycosyltransferase [Alphaproteobacteria bacterium]|nr:glycosyltransferase [Alphaproteobacteria bacterium]
MPDALNPFVCTIIVPAYNEAATIGHTLKALLAEAQADEFDLIVVCNGCMDDTAAVARAAAPSARVLVLEQASKTAALNAGIAAARTSPVVFLDADIITDAAAVRQLVHRLNWSGADMAYGAARFETSQCSWAVAAFYRAWQQNPYFDKQKMGGFFTVSRRGLDRLGCLPPVVNDDEYVRRRLLCNSVWVDAAPYKIAAPRSLASLIKVRSRVYRGNQDLKKDQVLSPGGSRRDRAGQFLGRLLRSPLLWPGAAIFFLVAILAHIRNALLRGQVRWEQDKSNRQAGTARG